MNNKYKEALRHFKVKVGVALDVFKTTVEEDLKAACEKWGFDFYADSWEYGVSYGTDYQRDKIKRLSYSNIREIGVATKVFEVLEPELAEVLSYVIEGWSLGSLMDDYQITTNDYDWVIIKVRADVLDVNEPPQILGAIRELDPNYEYYGWVPGPVAEAVVAKFHDDWESTTDTIVCLPSLGSHELTNPKGYKRDDSVLISFSGTLDIDDETNVSPIDNKHKMSDEELNILTEAFKLH